MIFALINKSKVTEIAVADSVDMLPAGQWVEAHANVYVGCPYVDEVFVGVTEPLPIPDPEPEPEADPVQALAWAKAAKLAEIMAGSNACAALVKSRYSALEIDSWPLQQAQAERVLAGEDLAPDTLLVVLAAANGVTVQDFAARVLHNVATAEALTKWVVATQQGYEVRLKAIMADGVLDDAGKIAAIRAIRVDYTLPE